MSRKLFTVCSLALLALVVASAHSQSPPVSTGRTISVEDAIVELIDDNLMPASDAGMVMAIHVKEGQTIEKDTVVAGIDNRETLAKQRIAGGEKEAAQAQADSDAELEVAHKAVAVAEAELESIIEILKGNPQAVSLTEKRKYQFQLDRARAQVKQAINEREIAKITVGVKQAQLDATDIELDRRQLKAPFKGQVVQIIKKVGDWVQPGEPVMHIMGLDRLRIRGAVLASQAAPSEVIGKPAVITVYGAGNRQHTLKGTIGFASPKIDGISASRQFRIWVDVDNEKVVDPITKIESWKIEPGAPANMTIDLTPPPPPRPVAAPKITPAKSGASPLKSGADKTGSGKSGGSFYVPPAKTIPATPAPSGKVEAFKPAEVDKERER